jgi:hypothetical protein
VKAMTQATETSEVLRHLDGIAGNIQDIRSDVQAIKLSQAQSEEQIKVLNQRLG